MPIALFAILSPWCVRIRSVTGRGVDGPDDQCIHRGWLPGEPGGRDGPGRDEDVLADAGPEDVERHQAGAAVHLHLQEGPAGDLLEPSGGPDVADYSCPQHQCSFSMSTPEILARSR